MKKPAARRNRIISLVPASIVGCVILLPLWIVALPVLLLGVAVWKLLRLLIGRLPESRQAAFWQWFWKVSAPRRLRPCGEGKQPPAVEYWDAYWRNADSFEAELRNPLHVPALGWARQAGWNRMLLVGTGPSLEPHALARLGFEVTAVEISPVAAALREDRLASADAWRLDLEEYARELREGGYPAEADRLAGSSPAGVRCLTEDFLRHEGSYQLILADKVLAYYTTSPETIREVARKLVALLEPGGLIMVSFVNDSHARRAYLNAFEEAGAELVLEWERLKRPYASGDQRFVVATLITG